MKDPLTAIIAQIKSCDSILNMHEKGIEADNRLKILN